MIIASTTMSIAWILFVVLVGGWIIYAIQNVRAGRDEVGSEVELAANRKPYYDDEVLESSKLERTQLLAVLFLAVIAISLPLYWMFEPQRAENAQEGWDKRFAGIGAGLFATTAEGGFNCAGCHGGMKATGGPAPYTITDAKTNEVKAVTWRAPALNTVLYRFSEDEVRYILIYGRPGSPMSPWGVDGGGPMNEQQIQTLIEYLKSIQLKPEGCLGTEDFTKKGDPAVCDGGILPESERTAIDKAAKDSMKAAEEAGTPITMGEALFNLDLNNGAYSCARCHTEGYSWGDPGVTGQGGYAYNLTGGSTAQKFPNEQDMIDFIAAGSQGGKKYAQHSQGTGRMPGFGHYYTEEQLKAIVEYVRSL
jgi:mono/diheme cytochrome c family protein